MGPWWILLLAGAGALTVLAFLILGVVWTVQWRAETLAERGAGSARRLARATLDSHARWLSSEPGAETIVGALQRIGEGWEEQRLREWVRARLAE